MPSTFQKANSFEYKHCKLYKVLVLMNISDNPIVESVAWLSSVEPVCVVSALPGHDTLICWNAISLAWTLVTQFTSDIANTTDHCVSHISSICQYNRPQVQVEFQSFAPYMLNSGLQKSIFNKTGMLFICYSNIYNLLRISKLKEHAK